MNNDNDNNINKCEQHTECSSNDSQKKDHSLETEEKQLESQNENLDEKKELENDHTDAEMTEENNEEIEVDSENKESSKKSPSKQENKFKEGQILTFVNVRFPGHAKSFPFHLGKKHFHYGQKVVAMSDRGIAVGYINSFPYQRSFEKKMLPIQNIIKVVTEKELKKESENFDKEHGAKELCEGLIKKLGLEMELTHVEYTQFGKKAVFYFTSPGRVDFRELVKELVSELKMRIELRQIYIRDRTAALGGIGPCGRELCCSSFLKKYGNVNIKMAKNQNLTLSPSKLNGVCGQLKCCLQYEDDVYTDKKQQLPEVDSFIRTQNGDLGKVEKIHILKGQFELITDQGKRRRYDIDQFVKTATLPPNWKFPEKFDFITDETYFIISQKDRSHKKNHNEKKSLSETNNLEKETRNEEVSYTRKQGSHPNKSKDPEVNEHTARKTKKSTERKHTNTPHKNTRTFSANKKNDPKTKGRHFNKKRPVSKNNPKLNPKAKVTRTKDES